MVRKAYIKNNTYQDSVALMRLSTMAAKMEGVNRASVMMGTPLNKTVLEDVGLFVPELASAQPSDLIVVVEAAEEDVVSSAISKIKDELNREATLDDTEGDAKPVSIAEALQKDASFNLVAISTPGEFAASEARKALKKGLNVFMFSDNVSIEDEIELKTYAHDHGLLVMGPDCGTSLLGGVPLGFVNIVNKGSIGLIGASGTGMQEVMCRIDQMGGGVSNAIGIGSHDLSGKVGGISMLDSMQILAADDDTKVIVLISKPPEESVAKKMCEAAKKLPVPVVVCFLGSESIPQEDNLYIASTLDDAARYAVSLAKGETPVAEEKAMFQPDAEPKGYIRALYSGGTLAYEAIVLLEKHGVNVFSNIAATAEKTLEDHRVSRENTVVDMGDDKFTVGKPHPMIDFTDRVARAYEEAKDANVKVILMDVVTGYGSIANPSDYLVPMLENIAKARPDLKFVIHLCGTTHDGQSIEKLYEDLSNAGAIVDYNHASAVEKAWSLLFE